MSNWRQWIGGIAALAAIVAVRAKDQCVAFTPQMQAAKTPEATLKRLQEGKARFVAGIIASTDMIGSLESATTVAGAKLVVVLGHSECGAIKGAIDDVKLGDLTSVLQQIRPALGRLDYKGVPSSNDNSLVQRLAEQNAKDVAEHLVRNSEARVGLVKDGKLKIVHAMHDVSSGTVAWLG